MNDLLHYTRIAREGGDELTNRQGEIVRIACARRWADLRAIEAVGVPEAVFGEPIGQPLTWLLFKGGSAVYCTDDGPSLQRQWAAYLSAASLTNIKLLAQ
ncbi:hypothetical protein [Hymenobacter lapidiphilus]|uniref:Uncharacterized protein n=1 Tax=Hymenobacter lapidiphilus TaxID=2608003 RepID=A0A7Y7PT52_9BACT|nr:hypothetical protein [Hymenobacter lapidiphilus]NVO33212.1 hypothetical protein [Hymenobacter lapidiphilus]